MSQQETPAPGAPSAPAEWFSAALDPPRAHGRALVRGVLRASPEDFVVEEDPGFAPDGDGPHVLLRVRKRGANTEWVARELARAAGQRPSDVGFAGLKDRHALATQWFSVPAGRPAMPWWRDFTHPDIEILEAHAHRRKLKRGALRGNRFRLHVREIRGDTSGLADRVAAIRNRGVANFFGEQRFGNRGNNLHAAWNWALRSSRPSKFAGPFALSAARSLVFNAVLAERVRRGTWATLQPGDVANLEGTGSIFDVAEVTPDLERRIIEQDIHPTGPMWGAGNLRTRGDVRALEAAVAERLEPLPLALADAGLILERRSLRVRVANLEAVLTGEALELTFGLPAGAFATIVVRELVETQRGEADA